MHHRQLQWPHHLALPADSGTASFRLRSRWDYFSFAILRLSQTPAWKKNLWVDGHPPMPAHHQFLRHPL